MKKYNHLWSFLKVMVTDLFYFIFVLFKFSFSFEYIQLYIF